MQIWSHKDETVHFSKLQGWSWNSQKVTTKWLYFCPILPLEINYEKIIMLLYLKQLKVIVCNNNNNNKQRQRTPRVKKEQKRNSVRISNVSISMQRQTNGLDIRAHLSPFPCFTALCDTCFNIDVPLSPPWHPSLTNSQPLQNYE